MSATTSIIDIKNNDLGSVLGSEQPVLVKIHATWCGPCKALAPVVEELANELQGKLVVAAVDADENRDLLGQHGVQAVPTLLLFKGGELVERLAGNQTKAALMSMLQPHL